MLARRINNSMEQSHSLESNGRSASQVFLRLLRN